MTFRDDLKKIDFKGIPTTEVADQVCAAARSMGERMNSIVSEPRSAYGANCYMDGIIAAQEHIRKEIA
jgi:hypothetical protein